MPIVLWVREPSTSNRCNYHMVVRSEITIIALADAIEHSKDEFLGMIEVKQTTAPVHNEVGIQAVINDTATV